MHSVRHIFIEICRDGRNFDPSLEKKRNHEIYVMSMPGVSSPSKCLKNNTKGEINEIFPEEAMKNSMAFFSVRHFPSVTATKNF